MTTISRDDNIFHTYNRASASSSLVTIDLTHEADFVEEKQTNKQQLARDQIELAGVNLNGSKKPINQNLDFDVGFDEFFELNNRDESSSTKLIDVTSKGSFMHPFNIAIYHCQTKGLTVCIEGGETVGSAALFSKKPKKINCLEEISDALQRNCGGVYFVNAQILSLASKLDFDSAAWKLKVKLSDGT